MYIFVGLYWLFTIFHLIKTLTVDNKMSYLLSGKIIVHSDYDGSDYNFD